MDLSKAFDTINHNILLRKLRKYGFSDPSIKLICNYFSERKQFVDYVGSASVYSDVITGVPQGSILGPLLFIIYINDICRSNSIFTPITYADDTTLLFSPNYYLNSEQLSILINAELENINEWFMSNKLSLNIDKTNYIIFHSSGTKPTNVNLRINSTSLVRVCSTKFLGLILDEHLKWDGHRKNIAIKINCALGVISKLRYVFPVSVLKILYFSLIHCHFNNHFILWGQQAELIFKLQKKAIRIICGKPYISHTTPLFRDLNILKVHDLYKLTLLTFYYQFEHLLLPEPLLRLPIFRNSHFHDYNTRHRHSFSTIKHFHHFYSKTSVSYALVDFINKLENGIKNKIKTHSLSNIITRFKALIINSYKISCNIRMCYVSHGK